MRCFKACSILLSLLVLVLVGCERRESQAPPPSAPSAPKPAVSLEDVKKEAGESLETGSEYLAQQTEKLVEDTHARIAELSEKFDELLEQASAKGEQVEESAQQWRDQFYTKAEALEDKLADLDEQSGDAWKKLQESVNAGVQDLQNAYDDAVAKLKAAQPQVPKDDAE